MRTTVSYVQLVVHCDIQLPSEVSLAKLDHSSGTVCSGQPAFDGRRGQRDQFSDTDHGFQQSSDQQVISKRVP